MIPAISIILPTIRPAGLPMVMACLRRQTVTDWELLVGTPHEMTAQVWSICDGPNTTVYAEPPKWPGDLYALNKTWNMLVRKARSPRLVFLVDWIWFPDDTLERFLMRPLDVGVSAVAHHYRDVVGGKPEGRWWTDPRTKVPFRPEHMELACASLPRDRVLAMGGFDEDYDRVAGASEKELCLRLAADGCQFELAKDIEARNWTHPKPEFPDWDTRFRAASKLFMGHAAEIRAGTRRNISKEPT